MNSIDLTTLVTLTSSVLALLVSLEQKSTYVRLQQSRFQSFRAHALSEQEVRSLGLPRTH